VSRWAAVGIAVALACQPSAADHEELGDRWYGGGAYRDALAEYQLGLKAHPGDADLEAKLGAAALHVGDYATAVNAYIALGEGDRSRAGEAADGLERSARAALGANDRSDAARGLAGLHALAPARPLGRYARLAALDAADRGDTAGAMALLPGAAAAAGDPRMTDSLLFVYGMAAVRARACSTAVPVFEGVIRRQRRAPAARRCRCSKASSGASATRRLPRVRARGWGCARWSRGNGWSPRASPPKQRTGSVGRRRRARRPRWCGGRFWDSGT